MQTVIKCAKRAFNAIHDRGEINSALLLRFYHLNTKLQIC